MLFFNRKKWRMHLYLNGVCIKKMKINITENPKDNIYPITIWFKKFIFGTNKVDIIVRPTRLIYTDTEKKITHWEFRYEEGIDT